MSDDGTSLGNENHEDIKPISEVSTTNDSQLNTNEVDFPAKDLTDESKSLEPHEVGFSKKDLTDERKPLDWDSKYPKTAQNKIRTECIYLVSVILLAPILSLIIHFSNELFGFSPDVLKIIEPYGIAWLGGAFGGALFGLKWTYHVIAKQLWHLDRRWWRVLIPIISGSLSLVFVLLISSSFLGIFDSRIANDSRSVFVIGFLVGYFSDNAIAKLVEVANTLFGNSSNGQ